MGGILCDDIENFENMKISCNIILAGWHLSKRDIILGFVLASVVLAITLY